MWSTLAYLVFRKIKSPTYCAKAKEYTLAHCLLAPLKKFPSSDANPVQSPSSGILRPLRSFRHWHEKNIPKPVPTEPPKPPCLAPQEAPLWQNKPRLVPGETLGDEVPVFSFRKSTGFLRPVRACAGSLRPRWGNDPHPPGQGPVWATQGPVWQKEKKTAHPGKQPPAQTANMPAFDFPPGARFPQNQQWREV